MRRYAHRDACVPAFYPWRDSSARGDDPGNRICVMRGQPAIAINPVLKLCDAGRDQYQALCRIAILDCQNPFNSVNVVWQAPDPEDTFGGIGDDAAAFQNSASFV